jgi:tRNA pseudouridine65 synthase
MPPLPILYQDDRYIAVHKPAGLLVHRTRISEDTRFLLQILRNQIGQWVYPVHRLDRPTSGVLILGLDSESARLLTQEFEHRRVEKRYLAIVRGYTDDSGVIDYPLREEKWKEPQQAITEYRTLAQVELPIPVGRYQSARYSLLEIKPRTGRMHQIRKHMKHIFHPIVGDTTHGDGKQNQLFREEFKIQRLLLIATELRFRHPYSGEEIIINSEPEPDLLQLFSDLGWEEASSQTGLARKEWTVK